MSHFITQLIPNHIKNILILSILLSLTSPAESKKKERIEVNTKLTSLSTGEISLTNGKKLKIYLAITPSDQQNGLSNIPDKMFKDSEGMLFFYLSDGHKRFWMPDTYFNLDIIFLDKDLKVLNIERNMTAHPAREKKKPVAITRTIYCRHVLELKASSKLAVGITIGSTLKWTSTPSLWQIESDIRQKR